MSFDPGRFRISEACQAAQREIRDVIERQELARLAALRKGEEPPQSRAPSCHDPRWVSRLAKILKEGELDEWMRDADVAAAHEDMAGPHLSRLRGWPEFKAIQEAHATIEIRWTPKVVARRDVGMVEVLAGRPRVTPAKDRLCWPEGQDEAPDFQLELSLPWWLLADHDQRERGLHDILCYLGWADGGPVLRKPDIVAHAATLGRFGVSSAREASAVFHAARHPSHELALREYGFDAITGAGEVWTHTSPRQQDLVPTSNAAARTRKGRPVPTSNASTEGEA
jgi:hypothetical protein